jgi:hypothetical protein
MSFFARLRHLSVLALAIGAVLLSEDGAVGQRRARQDAPVGGPTLDRSVRDNVERLLAEGMQTFRYDTFGSEDFWGGQVKLHQAIEGGHSALTASRQRHSIPRPSVLLA